MKKIIFMLSTAIILNTANISCGLRQRTVSTNTFNEFISEEPKKSTEKLNPSNVINIHTEKKDRGPEIINLNLFLKREYPENAIFMISLYSRPECSIAYKQDIEKINGLMPFITLSEKTLHIQRFIPEKTATANFNKTIFQDLIEIIINNYLNHTITINLDNEESKAYAETLSKNNFKIHQKINDTTSSFIRNNKTKIEMIKK